LAKSNSEKQYRIDSKIAINRKIGAGSYPFLSIFAGFETIKAVRDIFGKNTDQVLSKLKVELFPREGFMGVSDEDGHIFASLQYVSKGDAWSVYLDAVHELVHVRQFMEGKNLFDPAYSYVDRPTEIEAYRVAANEARRIGLDEQEIFDYLEVPWVTREELFRLAKACGVSAENLKKTNKAKSVK
jgi:hypothetical protein